MNFRVLDLDEIQGRSCVEGSSENNELENNSRQDDTFKETRAMFRFEVTVSLEELETLCADSFDEPIFVAPSFVTPEKQCYRRQCYCTDDCMVTSEFTISVYPGVIFR